MPYITDLAKINDHRYLYISVDPEHPLKMFQYLSSLCSHGFSKYYEIPLRNCSEHLCDRNIVQLYDSKGLNKQLDRSDLPPEIQALLTLIGQ